MITLPVPAIAAIQISCVVAAPLVATRSRAMRALAMLIAVADFVVPYCHRPGDAGWRILAGLTAMLLFVRTVDLCRIQEDVPALRRVLHVLAIVDTFGFRSVPRAFDTKRFGKALAFVPVTLAGVASTLWLAPRLDGALMWIARWGGGLVMAYASTEVVYAILEGLYLLFGVLVPIIHVHPALARTIGEFWGQRWNRNVGKWLDARFFRPLARRGHPRLGVVAAFLMSATLHAYLAEVALGLAAGLAWFGFFLMQGLAAMLEGPLGVRRWKAPLAHAWVIAWMVATAPLFVEPALRVLFPSFTR